MEHLVEREQEGQGPLGRRVARPLHGALLSLPLLGGIFLPACQEEVAGQEAGHISLAPEMTKPMRIWTGGQGEGPFVLVEELDRPANAKARIGGEEGLFRRTFQLPEDLRLLRVHALGVGVVEGPGQVLVDGVVYTPLGDPPEDADDRARLYWYSVTRGAQEFQDDPGGITRVSHLVAADQAPAVTFESKLQWQRGDLRMDLVARDWTGPQRRSFLDTPAEFHDE